MYSTCMSEWLNPRAPGWCMDYQRTLTASLPDLTYVVPQVAYDRLPMSGHLMWLCQLLTPVCLDMEQAISPTRLKFCPDREQASIRIIRGPPAMCNHQFGPDEHFFLNWLFEPRTWQHGQWLINLFISACMFKNISKAPWWQNIIQNIILYNQFRKLSMW